MKRLIVSSIFVSILGAAAAAGCGGGSKSSSTTQPRTAANDDPSCPVTVPGTSVTVEDTDTGAALVFVTTGDVAEVRKRVAAMVQMHNDHHGSMGALPDGKDAGGGHAGHNMGGGSAATGHEGHNMGGGSAATGHEGHNMGGGSAAAGHEGHNMGGGSTAAGHDMSKHAGHAGGMISVHSKAETADIEGGARFVLTAGDADVAKLQGELRMHAQHLSSGTCAMGSS